MENEDHFCEEEMKNPNLYITLDPTGGIWSATTFPWQEINPWTLNAPQ